MHIEEKCEAWMDGNVMPGQAISGDPYVADVRPPSASDGTTLHDVHSVIGSCVG